MNHCINPGGKKKFRINVKPTLKYTPIFFSKGSANNLKNDYNSCFLFLSGFSNQSSSKSVAR